MQEPSLRLIMNHLIGMEMTSVLRWFPQNLVPSSQLISWGTHWTVCLKLVSIP